MWLATVAVRAAVLPAFGLLLCCSIVIRQNKIINQQPTPQRTSLELHTHQVTLAVTTATHDGTEVTAVTSDFSLDPVTCEGSYTVTLPDRCCRLSACLTARIRLAAPGVNGEAAYQEFRHDQT